MQSLEKYWACDAIKLPNNKVYDKNNDVCGCKAGGNVFA